MGTCQKSKGNFHTLILTRKQLDQTGNGKVTDKMLLKFEIKCNKNSNLIYSAVNP